MAAACSAEPTPDNAALSLLAEQAITGFNESTADNYLDAEECFGAVVSAVFLHRVGRNDLGETMWANMNYAWENELSDGSPQCKVPVDRTLADVAMDWEQR